MAAYTKRWAWQFGLVSALAMGGVAALSGNYALAQITPDATLGTESSVVTPNVNLDGLPADQIDGGAVRGANLFHSFREFNVGDGQRVYFANPVGIANILSRVTGADPSDILGTLGVDGNANLFLLNPNGIIFGPNASLDVGRSFYVTTASGIQFGNQGEFSATNPQSPSSLLTINPSAFFFTARATQGTIINQSQATQTVLGNPTDGLQVPDGQTLLLLGGNVTVDNGRLIARGGRVEIGAVVGPGNVGLDANESLSVPDGMQRADVVFTNRVFTSGYRSGIDVRLGNGGDIGITAANISVFGGSQLRAGIAAGLGTPESQAGDLIVNATGEIRMTGDDSRMANDVRQNAIGKGGNLTITARSLVVTDGAQLSASTFGIGDTGNVVIAADRVSFSGTRADELGGSAAFTRVERGAQGKGGIVQISTNTLEVTNGAALVSATEGEGDAGDVVIVARDRVSFDGISAGRRFNSGAFSNVSPGAQGKGGDIAITTGSLSVINGAQLVASTFGQGDAGRVTISARDTVSFGGVGSNGFPSAAGSTVQPGAMGNGGDIDITTGSLSLTNEALLSTSSVGSNNQAGNIKVAARSIRLDNQAFLSADTQGGEGNIVLDSQGLVLRRGSSITTNAEGSEITGGNITLNTDVLAALENSDISANSDNFFGGRVTINAQGIFGTEFRLNPTSESDITATGGSPEFSGTVQINSPDVDPSEGLANLPTEPVDAEIAQDCQAGDGKATSRFINTGSGGLPTNPYEPLDSGEILADVQPPTQWGSNRAGAASTSTSSKTIPDQIVEAQGWNTNKTGEVVLIAKVPPGPSQRGCHLR